MSTNKSRVNKQLWPWWRLLIAGLNIIALVLSAIMSWHYLVGGSMIGCGGGSPCEQVLNSKWSAIAGIFPVSGLAVGAYLALFAAGLFIGPDTETSLRRLAWKTMLVLAGAIAGSAIWFTILQKWIIGEFCPYCMTAHITGIILAGLIIWRSVSDSDHHSIKSGTADPQKVKNISPATPGLIILPRQAVFTSLSGLVIAGALATFQVLITPSAVYVDGESQITLPSIDYKAAPMVGSPAAPYIVNVLFDYQCSHCQRIHFMLGEAVNRYNGKLAFALCPTPLNSECNQFVPPEVTTFKNSCELAKIGLAVWLAKSEVFAEFENWMFTYESGDGWYPRSPEAVRAKAVELVGKDAFDVAMADSWINEYLQTGIQIYGQTIQDGKGGIPKMVYGSQWVIPEPSNADDLVMILQQSLGVPAP